MTSAPPLTPPSRSGHPRGPAVAMRWFVVGLTIALAGYLLFSRTFAYIHIPGRPVFVGELILLLGIVQVARVLRVVPAVVRESLFLRVLLCYMAFGALRLLPDMWTWGFDAIRDSAIWYYGVFALLVAVALRIGATSPEELTNWYRRIVPVFLIWSPAAVVLSRLFGAWVPTIPGTETSILSFKPGDAAVHAAAALAFMWIWGDPRSPRDVRMRHALTAVALVSLVIAGSQNRGGLVTAAGMLALTLLLAPTRKLIMASGVTIVSLLLVFALVSDVTIDLGRRQLSLAQLRDNVASTFEPGRLDRDDTVRWRLEFWREIVVDTAEQRHGPFGIGFGPNLAHHYEFRSGSYDTDQPLRSAHNSHVTLLARTGFGGAALWLLLWGVWFGTMARVVRSSRTRNGDLMPDGRVAAWLIIAVAGMLVNAVFDPTLEGPQVAIWLWSCAGLGAALAARQARTTRAGTSSASSSRWISSR